MRGLYETINNDLMLLFIGCWLLYKRTTILYLIEQFQDDAKAINILDLILEVEKQAHIDSIDWAIAMSDDALSPLFFNILKTRRSSYK